MENAEMKCFTKLITVSHLEIDIEVIDYRGYRWSDAAQVMEQMGMQGMSFNVYVTDAKYPVNGYV